MRLAACLLTLIVVAGCATTSPDKPLPKLAIPPLSLAPDVLKDREEQLAAARANYEKNPNDADAIIWLGRRTAYLGSYEDAISIFTEGIRKHPKDARMYRHRGHRFITVRLFDRAIADLQKAAELVRGKPDEVEPDGLPNVRNIPIGSLQSNICYHLGLAHYLKGELEQALRVYAPCNKLSSNPDRLVSTSHWLYMTLQRLGRVKEAEGLLEPISSSMEVIESVAYLKLLLMYDGDIAPEELAREDPATTDGATILYGVGSWYLYNGQLETARAVFQKVIDGKQWGAFGYIAAEVELARK